jgi:hypothetical protein
MPIMTDAASEMMIRRDMIRSPLRLINDTLGC